MNDVFIFAETIEKFFIILEKDLWSNQASLFDLETQKDDIFP